MDEQSVKELELFLRHLYKGQLTDKPKSIMNKAPQSEIDKINKKRQLGYVHYASIRYENLGAGKIHKVLEKANTARTYKTIMNAFTAFDDYKGYHVNTWYTPNTLFTHLPYKIKVKGNTFGGRYESNVRWLNCFYIDIDSKDVGPDEIRSIISAAGIPAPNMINETMNGYHVYWLFSEAIFSCASTVALYKNILTHLQKALSSIKMLDVKLKDTCRYMQIPRNIRYQNYESLATFAEFKTWYNKTVLDSNARKEVVNPSGKRPVLAYKHIGSSLDTAINIILKGVKKKQRNEACFALACYYASKGYTQDDVETFLLNWNEKNEESESHPASAVIKTIKSAFNSRIKDPKDGNIGIPYKMISEISGVNVCGWYKHRKDRKVRLEKKGGRSHFSERVFDIIMYMNKHRISTLSGSQEQIADALNMPLSTFKEILRLSREGLFPVLKISVAGKGRYAETTLFVNEILAKSFNVESDATFDYASMTGTDGLNSSMVQSAYSFNPSCRDGWVGTHKKGGSPPSNCAIFMPNTDD